MRGVFAVKWVSTSADGGLRVTAEGQAPLFPWMNVPPAAPGLLPGLCSSSDRIQDCAQGPRLPGVISISSPWRDRLRDPSHAASLCEVVALC